MSAYRHLRFCAADSLQNKLDATVTKQTAARDAAQRYLSEGKALCVGGGRFAEAKEAFERGLAEKPSDPELVRNLADAIRQFTTGEEEGGEPAKDQEQANVHTVQVTANEAEHQQARAQAREILGRAEAREAREDARLAEVRAQD